MKVILVPLERFDERYTEQWYRWFNLYLKDHKYNCSIIEGIPLSQKIREGEFLDVVSTNHFKATQLSTLCRYIDKGIIDDDSIIFFMDLWFPGIEMLAYIRDGLGKKFKIAGVLHAGTWDHYDFLFCKGMREWGKFIERGWFELYDYIFLATEFHKKLIQNHLHEAECYLGKKVHVTGLPIFPEFTTLQAKEKIVVFPHRLAPEKDPEMFDRVSARLKSDMPNWQFLKTKEVCKNKKEYYDLLNKSAISVSCAKQETWGIAMIESTLCGCVPIVPDRLSYSELYLRPFKYSATNPEESLVKKILTMVKKSNWARIKTKKLVLEQQRCFIKAGYQAIPKMFEIIKNKGKDGTKHSKC